MNYTISKGTPEDYEDIIDFGNYVFGVDFPSLLPKLYANHKETAQHHHIVKEGHRIKAVVGSFPLELKVFDNYLKIRGIGTVSVHKYSRHSGYMKLLMNNAVKEMEDEGCDLAILGGQRQRYEYWGFTPSGINLNLNFNSSNIKHAKIDITDSYGFIRYNEKIATDLDKAVKLHDSQIVHAKREKDNFIDISSSWDNNVLFIYKNEEFSGYICSSNNHENISEIVLTNPDDIEKVIISYMKYFNLNNTNVVLYLHRYKEFMKLSRLCERYSINSTANVYIINYANVIKSFMVLKNNLTPLEEGMLILNVEGRGKYKIEVKAGIITVEETDMPQDISLSHLDATALLFSHSSFINSAYNFSNPLVKSWFPLPLFYPGQDNV
jgi:predicted N-acetyltransferase YhbS